jgi:hypothetical protein
LQADQGLLQRAQLVASSVDARLLRGRHPDAVVPALPSVVHPCRGAGLKAR